MARATVSPPTPESKTPIGASAPVIAAPYPAPGAPRIQRGWGPGRSGPELGVQAGGGLFQVAGVGAGGQVFPPGVADDDDDVGRVAGASCLFGDGHRGVQDPAGGDAGEDALDLQQL